MRISVIGKPSIVNRNGEALSVPGQQSWALLARLLLARRPLSRRTLASEIFCDATDPLGALRWSLASLRRALGSETLRGDPVELNLPSETEVDLWQVAAFQIAAIDPAELLEGIEPAASHEFSTWLLIAREQVASQLQEGLRRATIAALASSDAPLAIKYAERAVRLRPFDESGHVLLVKALAAADRMDAASAHIKATEQVFEKELGEQPSRALRLAARRNLTDLPAGVSEEAAIDALIKSGVAALAAGVPEAGLDCLRQAAVRAEKSGNPNATARAFHELGSALVHAIRGFDDEGAVMLRKAADTATGIGASGLAAGSLRELGYLEALAGRRPSAARYLQEALEFAAGDDDALAGVHAVIGFNLVDGGQHSTGLTHFARSIALARHSGNRRREVWALGIGGWGQLRAGNAALAETWLTRCHEICEDMRWVAFQPWPQAILAEARLAQGKHDNSAVTVLQETLALSSQLGDPCWEAASARSLALVKIATRDFGEARYWLDLARAKCCAVTDLYAALLVEIVADQMSLETMTGAHDQAAATARQLLSLAARTHADAHLERALTVLRG
ncbi:bacterial transcriptional activator domain-containing protein [Sinirhodobacter sp. WL0062]|uniref:Bacterial transcriptional activator domain-containing protein n=1 Tax=Rhodobacter flavimaris TaxID=2907145 RepID=A0ABS8Z1M6_9RHOB|nr:bacterial transcriptional activator domain-containing protein [Sinirhodobacter sp. WL0062]MCE5974961.1 bacterial transcriptional activator domain-containing protein [Sinirhodobacter sp. WL0062]